MRIAVVALELKWKAPKAHTLLELVYVRWGRVAHVVSQLLHTSCTILGCYVLTAHAKPHN